VCLINVIRNTVRHVYIYTDYRLLLTIITYYGGDNIEYFRTKLKITLLLLYKDSDCEVVVAE
jgi:hypothetical protein